MAPRGNVLDAASTTIIGFLPYNIAVLIPLRAGQGHRTGANLTNLDVMHLVPYVFYCWALMLVFFVAVLTGWGHDSVDREAWQVEQKVLEDHAGAEPAALWTFTSIG